MMLTLNKYMMQMRETRGGQLGGRKRKIDADNHKYVIFNVIYVSLCSEERNQDSKIMTQCLTFCPRSVAKTE